MWVFKEINQNRPHRILPWPSAEKSAAKAVGGTSVFARVTDVKEREKEREEFAEKDDFDRKELVEILSKQLVEKSTEEWLKQFKGKVPSGPVNTIEQALSEEQVHARGMVANVNHPSLGIIKQVVSSIITDGSNQALTPGPALGENTDALLSDLLSMNRDQIKKLRDKGAVG